MRAMVRADATLAEYMVILLVSVTTYLRRVSISQVFCLELKIDRCVRNTYLCRLTR